MREYYFRGFRGSDWQGGLQFFGEAQRRPKACFKLGNEYSSSIEDWEFLD
jgi:hypothetical protein